MKSWFISDLHLKDQHERNSQILLRFLFQLNEKPKDNQLFLLGDVFDFWVSSGKIFEKHFQLIVDEIVKFKNSGGEVYYFEGNHDFHVDVYWTKKYGIPVIEDKQYFKIGDYTVRLEHGDLINPDDLAYARYRATVRHPLMELFAHSVPARFLKWLGERASSHSRKKSKEYFVQMQDKMRPLIRRHAETVFNEKSFDLIITGHMHVEDDYTFQVGPRIVRSVNLGTWMQRPLAFMIEDAKAEWVYLDGK